MKKDVGLGYDKQVKICCPATLFLFLFWSVLSDYSGMSHRRVSSETLILRNGISRAWLSKNSPEVMA